MKFFFAAFWTIFMVLGFISCQEDDVCIEQTTPRMTTLFLDSTTREPISLDTIIFGSVNANGDLVEYGFVNASSAQVALSLSNLNRTEFNIRYSQNNAGTNDFLQLNYTAEQEFSSKACGFKLNYRDLTIGQTSLNTIQEIELQQTEITNEQDTILYLYFNN